MTKGSQLSALVEIIAQATKVIEAAYNKSGSGVPCLDNTEEHPFDEGPSDYDLRIAVQTVQGACAQLSATVARPSHVMKFMGFYESVALRVVLQFKVADAIGIKPEGTPVSEISLATGVHERKLDRLLKLLSAKHVFRQVAEGVYAHNRLSKMLLSNNPLSKSGLHSTEEMFCSATFLPEVLADPVWGPSESPTQTCYNKWIYSSEPAFVYYEGATPEGAERGTRFGQGMVGWNQAIEASAILRDFPWSALPHGTTFCDVGGGVGDVCIELAKRNPHMIFKLQDLPKRIQQAQESVWPVKYPQAIEIGRIEFKAIDFFKETPIPGCDIYYMKNIIHNWPDQECATILSGVREAMKEDSRLLIHEYIIQQGFRVSEDVAKQKQAPEPLLPNYGEGKIRQYYLDIDMMAILNSRERTLEEFIKLGNGAGLEFVKLWSVGETGFVEFRRA